MMSSVHFSAVVTNPTGTLLAILDIVWRVPYRVGRSLYLRHLGTHHDVPSSSIWIATASSVFAACLRYNWKLLLARPRNIEPHTGLLFPASLSKTQPLNEKDKQYGFHGYLYTSHLSPAFGRSDLSGASAVWIHAHGGGFMIGEARQYHATYMRWVDKAYQDHGLDLRVLAVEYRKLLKRSSAQKN
jgi:acetyl esterase/lipase